MRKKTAPRKKTTRKKRPVKTLIDTRRSGAIIFLIWTVIAIFA